MVANNICQDLYGGVSLVGLARLPVEPLCVLLSSQEDGGVGDKRFRVCKQHREAPGLRR